MSVFYQEFLSIMPKTVLSDVIRCTGIFILSSLIYFSSNYFHIDTSSKHLKSFAKPSREGITLDYNRESAIGYLALQQLLGIYMREAVKDFTWFMLGFLKSIFSVWKTLKQRRFNSSFEELFFFYLLFISNHPLVACNHCIEKS